MMASDLVSRTLVLRGDCDGKEVKPTLLDYVRIFPNLVSVRIELVYPRDCSRKQIETSNATSSHPIVPARSTTNRLKTVSVSITKDLTWNGTKQESFTKKIIPQLKASLKAAGIDRLESFHLEIATSRSLEDRDSLDYWSDLGKRIGSACPIPANEVSLDIGEIKIKGEASKFMVSTPVDEEISLSDLSESRTCSSVLFKAGRSGSRPSRSWFRPKTLSMILRTQASSKSTKRARHP
jgi:hypothetical protein